MKINLDKNWIYTDELGKLCPNFTAAGWVTDPRLKHVKCGIIDTLLKMFRPPPQLSQPRARCSRCRANAPQKVREKVKFIIS